MNLLLPLGGPRAQLLWRGFGVGAVILALLLRDDDAVAVYLRTFPWQLHATTACGLALAAFGPRLVLLVATAAAWLAFLVVVTAGETPLVAFIADEYLLFTLLPLFGSLSAIVALRARRTASDPPLADELDDGQAAVFRVGLATALALAAFHKLNHDFLDRKVSCVTMLAARLDTWSLPALRPSPAMIVALELLAPVLLLRWPRLGIAWTLVLVTGLGHVGPAAFNALVAVGALAFLPRASVQALAPRARRLAVVAALAIAAAAPLSLHLYRGLRAWSPFFALECALIVAAVVVVAAPRSASRERPAPRQRRLCAVLLTLLLACGLGPYLGLNYRYSFAMLSNLRVDDDRWNHLMVPKWTRVRGDRLVHVLEVRTAKKFLKAPGNPARVATLVPGVYAPQELRERVEENRSRKLQIGTALRYRGETHVFEDMLHDGAAQQFVAALPDERLLPEALRLSRRQVCVH